MRAPLPVFGLSYLCVTCKKPANTADRKDSAYPENQCNDCGAKYTKGFEMMESSDDEPIMSSKKRRTRIKEHSRKKKRDDFTNEEGNQRIKLVHKYQESYERTTDTTITANLAGDPDEIVVARPKASPTTPTPLPPTQVTIEAIQNPLHYSQRAGPVVASPASFQAISTQIVQLLHIQQQAVDNIIARADKAAEDVQRFDEANMRIIAENVHLKGENNALAEELAKVKKRLNRYDQARATLMNMEDSS